MCLHLSLRVPHLLPALVLAIMIIPIVTAISREIFDQTPLDRIQAAYALGASKLAMIRAVVIPYGRGGVVGGAMLGLGRAMGETVAVYTVLNVVYQINWQVLFGAGGNVASLILLKFGEAGPEEVDALMAAGLVLFLLTLGGQCNLRYLDQYSLGKRDDDTDDYSHTSDSLGDHNPTTVKHRGIDRFGRCSCRRCCEDHRAQRKTRLCCFILLVIASLLIFITTTTFTRFSSS
jgi:hypothetical protein